MGAFHRFYCDAGFNSCGNGSIGPIQRLPVRTGAPGYELNRWLREIRVRSRQYGDVRSNWSWISRSLP